MKVVEKKNSINFRPSISVGQQRKMKKSLFAVALAVAVFLGYEWYKLPKYDTGDKAENFNSILLDGSKFNLSDIAGSYVLLSFWGSWCPPCRAESPELVQLYDTYHTKQFEKASGFEIVSIAIETSPDSWKKAIDNDNLDWKYHIIQRKRFQSPIAQLYHIKEIPTRYLLDTEGNVVMVNPSMAEISTFLNNG
jgi:thiol-disulfide isomerase/thioredoxin